MRDGVADVLAQRARLDRGAGPGFIVSAVLHVAVGGWLAFAAMRGTPPQPVGMVNIQFASAPRTSAPAARIEPARPKPAAEAPQVPPAIEQPKPRIDEPKPAVQETPKPAEKNTVPLSPFGQSTKKGSENPAPAKPAQTAAAPAVAPGPAAAGTLPGAGTAEVPVGGSGVTGLEGGDFPYTLYITGMQRRIGTNWIRPPVNAGTTTVIYFRIQRDGSIGDARVATSSGNGTFDRAALSAVRSSSPLNPLPFGYNGTYLGVHLTFR